MQRALSPNIPSLFGSDDSQTIQNAIAAAEADGSRQIVIPRYNARTDKNEWRIPTAILVPSNFTIILDNCYMVQETGIHDNMFTNANTRNRALVTTPEGRQENISIFGRGNVILDGGVHNRRLEKTCRTLFPDGRGMLPNTMFFWCNVTNLHVEDLHIENQRWWAMTHISCSQVFLKNLDFYAIPHVTNMDGIDLRIGCHDFTIENITGRTGDDTLALTALPQGFESRWLVQGTEPDIHDVRIRNMKSDPYTQYVVRLLNQDGSQIYNLEMDTLMDVSDYATKKRSGSCLCIGSPYYFKERQVKLGELRNITARNITTRGADGVLLGGTAQNILLSNVKTYRDNLVGLGVRDFCEVDNFTVEHFWYDANQQQIFTGRESTPETFPGSAFLLDGVTGNMVLKDIHVGKARTAVTVGAGLDVQVEGLTCELVGKDIDVVPGGSATLDGEVR